MININSFSLLVRKGVILDFMDDTIKHKGESKKLETLTFQKVKYKKVSFVHAVTIVLIHEILIKMI